MATVRNRENIHQVIVVDSTGADVGQGTTTSPTVVAQKPVSTATTSSVNDNNTSQQLLAANPTRNGAYFFNDSTADAYIKLGATASTTDFTMKVLAGDGWEMPSSPVYTGRIDCIWSADASGAMRITEL